MSSYNDKEDPMKYLLNKDIMKEGTNVIVCHNIYSDYQEYKSDILRIGQKGIIIKVGKMMKINKDGLDIHIYTVKFNDGHVGVYFPSNLKRI